MGNGFSLAYFLSEGEFKAEFIIKVFEKFIKYEVTLRILPLYWYYIKK